MASFRHKGKEQLPWAGPHHIQQSIPSPARLREVVNDVSVALPSPDPPHTPSGASNIPSVDCHSSTPLMLCQCTRGVPANKCPYALVHQGPLCLGQIPLHPHPHCQRGGEVAPIPESIGESARHSNSGDASRTRMIHNGRQRPGGTADTSVS